GVRRCIDGGTMAKRSASKNSSGKAKREPVANKSKRAGKKAPKKLKAAPKTAKKTQGKAKKPAKKQGALARLTAGVGNFFSRVTGRKPARKKPKPAAPKPEAAAPPPIE